MSHGLRGRLALLGTGLLLSVGCMNDDPKPIGKPPLPMTQTGSTVKPNLPASGTTYGGGVQSTGRPNPNTDYFKTASTAPAIPGSSLAPPSGVVPATTPTATFDPTVGSRPASPTYPPPGYDLQPPMAPGGPTGSYPMAPTPPAGAVNPYGR